MLPEMPQCKSPTTFHSARLADVYSAFFILIAGGLTAISIWIAERIWNKRRQMKDTIVRGMRQSHLMSKSHLPHIPHLPHFPSLSHFSHLHIHAPDGQSNDQCVDLQLNLTKDKEILPSNLFPATQDFRSKETASPSVVNDNEGIVNLDKEDDKPRLKPRFCSFRRQISGKRVSFSGVSKQKLKRTETAHKLGDNTVFPFHQ